MGLALVAAGYAVMWVAGYHLAGLVVGVIVLDIGQQSLQIGNQTRIFSLVEGARSRVNTIYMIVYFLGGAAGSALSTAAWARWQWNGVCALGVALLALAGIRHGIGGRGKA
jgi:predicted MFS family arabinose efflux permease